MEKRDVEMTLSPSSNGEAVDIDTEHQVSIKESNNSCIKSLSNFSEITSIHGINKLFDDGKYICRRLVWLAIVLLAIILVSYQMIQSFLIYFSFKTTFSIKLDYKSPLNFPAVTICNHNSFKITTAAKHEFYDYLDSLQNNVGDDDDMNLDNATLSRITTSQMVKWNRHELDDLIKTCEFNGIPCNRSSFQVFKSDKDICYMFNNDEKDSLKTKRTGSDSGLRLFLNIEQYEYMRSKSQAAGIKLFVHHQGFLPIHAVSIPPGMKAFVSLKYAGLSLMKPPYGKCGSRKLSLYKHYSSQGCLLECRIRKIEEACNCSLAEEKLSNKSECTMLQYKHCISPLQDSLSVTMQMCNCTIDCTTVDYTTSLSFSRISTFDTEQIMKILKDNVSQRVIDAREVFYRKNNDTQMRIQRTLIDYIDIAAALNFSLHSAEKQINTFRRYFTTFKTELSYKEKMQDFLMDRLVYNMRNNFVRGWLVNDERYLTPFTQGYLKLIYGLQYAFDIIPEAKEPYRSGVYAAYDTKLQEYMNLTLIAKENFYKVVDKIRNLKTISTYKTFPKRFYNSVFVHQNLIHTDFNKTDKFASEALTFIDNYHDYFHEFKTIMTDVYEGQSNLTRDQFNSKAHSFRKLVRRIFYRLYMYRNNTIDTALSKAILLSSNYNYAKADFNKYVKNVAEILKNILNFAKDFQLTLGRSVIKAQDLARKYLGGNITMLELSEFLQSKQSLRSFSDLYQQLDQMTIQTMTLKDELSKSKSMIFNFVSQFFTPEMNHIYRKISNDIDCLCQSNQSVCLRDKFSKKTRNHILETFNYIHKNAYGTELNFTCQRLKEVMNCEHAEDTMQNVVFRYHSHFHSSVFFFIELTKLTGLKSTLATANTKMIYLSEIFKEEIKLSKNFIKNNLIQVQLFYDSLSTVSQEEEPAYGPTQLFSDIGGNLGLCMGGSLISVIEIFDFIILDILRKCGL